jgi:deferrochelatase/peroxidase EfeB
MQLELAKVEPPPHLAVISLCSDGPGGFYRTLADVYQNRPGADGAFQLLLGFGREFFLSQWSAKSAPFELEHFQFRRAAPFQRLTTASGMHYSIAASNAVRDAQVLIALRTNSESDLDEGVARFYKLAARYRVRFEVISRSCIPSSGRNVLGFHEGLSIIRQPALRHAIACARPLQRDAWMTGGTYCVYLRFIVDMKRWNQLSTLEQEAMVGREKITGKRISAPQSHVGLMRRRHHPPGDRRSLQVLREVWNFGPGPLSDSAGLDFFTFHESPARVFEILSSPHWLGARAFGGADRELDGKIFSVQAAGVFALPPVIPGQDFPGASLFKERTKFS